MSNRELVIDLVRKLPEDAPLEDIIEKIAFIAGVREGLAEADRGEVISLAELQDLIKSWDTESS
jgi:predicted transcriptional regulator